MTFDVFCYDFVRRFCHNILDIREIWLGRELNPRHEDFQSSALPTELPSRAATKSEIRISKFENVSDAGWSLWRILPRRQAGSIADEGSGQIDRRVQQVQIKMSRNFARAELLQMRREPLRVEQGKAALAQTFDQRPERDL